MAVIAKTVMGHSLGDGYVTPPLPGGKACPIKFFAIITY
jgi:hypothetical protein